jgi:hypothetical protein
MIAVKEPPSWRFGSLGLTFNLATLASFFAKESDPSVQSALVLPHAQDEKQWCESGIQGIAIFDALSRKHGLQGNCSSVRRFLQSLIEASPKATVEVSVRNPERFSPQSMFPFN